MLAPNRPDGRDESHYQKYATASFRHVAWQFLRRNFEYEWASHQVDEMQRSAAEVAAQFALRKFKRFQEPYYNNKKPRFSITRGAQMYRHSANSKEVLRKAKEGDIVFVVGRDTITVGKQAVGAVVANIRSQLFNAASEGGSLPLKQIQLKRHNFPVLLQLLDLEAAGASREEICRCIKPLRDTAVNGPQHMDKLLYNLRRQAQHFVTVGWKELVIVARHHDLFPLKAARAAASLNSK